MEALFVIANLAFAMNVPLGLWRTRTRRLSWRWIVALHLAVPPIVALRFSLHVSPIYIPILIAAAVLGQMAGGWLGRRAGVKAVESNKGG